MVAERFSDPKIGQVRKLCQTALMAALIGAGAFVFIPMGNVPITFQDFFVMLAGLSLGVKRGSLAVLLYMLAGSLGLPVFSGGRSGLGHFLTPTGGYLAGFLPLVFFAGLGGFFARKIAPFELSTGTTQHYKTQLKRMLVAFVFILPGMVMLYLLGAFGLMHSMSITFAEAFAVGILPFIPFGISKAVLAVILWNRLSCRGLL